MMIKENPSLPKLPANRDQETPIPQDDDYEYDEEYDEEDNNDANMLDTINIDEPTPVLKSP